MAEFQFIQDAERLRALAPVVTAPLRHHVFVCTGSSCSARDSAKVFREFETQLTGRGILFGKAVKGKNPRGNIILTECSSVGFCAIGPTVLIYPDGVWYAQVRATDVPEIIEEHLLNGRVVERLALMNVPCSPESISKSGGAQPTNGGDWEA